MSDTLSTMHRRLIELATISRETFAFACPLDDAADAILLADVQGWAVVAERKHPVGVLMTFRRRDRS